MNTNCEALEKILFDISKQLKTVQNELTDLQVKYKAIIDKTININEVSTCLVELFKAQVKNQ